MSDPKIHLGCGPLRLDGWINLDLRRYPAADVVSDVRDGLPFTSARYIFAEHFVEHLDLDEAIALLTDCRRVLAADGVLRLATPNLDWVWATSYSSRWTATSATTASIDPEGWLHDAASTVDCLELNKAFHGWEHRFLFNRSMLGEALGMAGFAELCWCAYGESGHPGLAGLERHPRDRGIAGIPDVLIVEASGVGEHRVSPDVGEKLVEYRRARDSPQQV